MGKERFQIEATVKNLGVGRLASTLKYLKELHGSLDGEYDLMLHGDQIVTEQLEDVIRRLQRAYSNASMMR